MRMFLGSSCQRQTERYNGIVKRRRGQTRFNRADCKIVSGPRLLAYFSGAAGRMRRLRKW